MINLLHVQLFLAGVISSYGLCMMSCWPVALPYVTAAGKGWKGTLKAALVFLTAKLAMYGVMGFVSGLFGRLFIGWLHEYKDIAFMAAGLAVVALGIKAAVAGGHPCGGLLKRITRSGGVTSLVLMGIIVGLLPCATTMAVMAFIAFTAEGVWAAALLGLSFGAGKFFSPLIPASLLAGYLSDKVKINNKWIRYTCGVMVILLGVRLMFMGNIW